MKVYMLFDPGIPFLRNYPTGKCRKWISNQVLHCDNVHNSTRLEAILTSSGKDWLKTVWYVHTMENYRAIKKRIWEQFFNFVMEWSLKYLKWRKCLVEQCV